MWLAELIIWGLILFSIIFTFAFIQQKHIKDKQTYYVFFQDVVFSLFSAFTIFTFLLSVTNGELRGFVFVSIAVGFIASRLTISRVWIWLLKLIIGIIKAGIRTVSKAVYAGFDTAERNIAIFSKKSVKDLKKLLKNARKLLYTKRDRKV